MALKALVDADNTALTSFLLPEDKFIGIEDLAPSELAQIRYAKSEETAASDK